MSNVDIKTETLNTEKVKKEKIKFKKFHPNKDNFFIRNLFIILSFFLPFLFMFVSFAIRGIYPFGNEQILVTDLWHQYYPFLVDFQDKLQSGGGLLWTWKVGGGTNFIALMSYYLTSPLNFLCVFVPKAYLREFLYVITCVKIGCAGGFFAIFLRRVFKKNDISLIVFSVMYALCSFIMGYYWCVIWLDTIALLPLVVLGVFLVLKENRFTLYIVSLGLSILANYYIGLFSCIFVLIVAIGYTIVEWTNVKTAFINLLKMIVYSVLGIGLSAIVTLPAYFALSRANSATSTFPSSFTINIGSSSDLKGVIEAFGKVISNSVAFVNPTDKEGLPNVYCGVIAIVLGLLFLCCKQIKWRERIFCFVIEGFFVYSFIDRRLDYMWHGFHYPNMLPYRFSFLFSFVLIYMAFRMFQHIEELNPIQIAIGIAGVLIVLGITICNEDAEKIAIFGTALISVLVLTWLVLYVLNVVPKKVLALALCIIALAEGACTAYIGVKTVGSSNRSSYPASAKEVSECLEQISQREKNNEDLYHTEITKYSALNDVALYGMDGISMFNSMTTKSVSDYMEAIGICSWPTSNRYTYQDSSAYTNMLLNIKYLVATNSNFLDTNYGELIHEAETIKAIKQKYYVPQCFVVKKDILDFDIKAKSSNPIDNQNEIFRLTTGLDKDIYDYLEVDSIGHSDYEEFPVDKTSFGHYSFQKTQGEEANEHFKYNYVADRDGSAVIYFTASNTENCTIKINDQDISTNYIKRPYIMNAGTVKKGDKISVYAEAGKTSSGSVEVYCAMVNDDMLKKAYKYYNSQHLNASFHSDDRISGQLKANEDGIVYTSIAYDPGWKITVDGKVVETKSIADGGVIAFNIKKGDHFINMTYTPEGFIVGSISTILCLAILIFLSVFAARKRKKKIIKT